MYPVVISFANSVADQGSGAFWTPGSGMGKKSGSGSGMNNPEAGSISESLETICWAETEFPTYLNSIRIRYPGWKKFGSAIQDKKKYESWKNIPQTRGKVIFPKIFMLLYPR